MRKKSAIATINPSGLLQQDRYHIFSNKHIEETVKQSVHAEAELSQPPLCELDVDSLLTIRWKSAVKKDYIDIQCRLWNEANNEAILLVL